MITMLPLRPALVVVLLIGIIEVKSVTDSRGMEGKIVKGYSADIAKYPHAVYLAIIVNGGDVFTCGSSILNQKMLITAAHCFGNCGKCSIECIAGSTDTERPEVVRKGIRFMTHADYDEQTNYADIALLVLNMNLPLGPKIKRVIVLPSFPDNARGEVAGWGVIDEMKTPTSRLKHVSQKVWNIDNCNRAGYVIKGVICGQSTEGYPYSGDSGSALLSDTYQLLGLVSFRRNHNKDLIVYTNASYFYNWIRIKTAFLYCHQKSR